MKPLCRDWVLTWATWSILHWWHRNFVRRSVPVRKLQWKDCPYSYEHIMHKAAKQGALQSIQEWGFLKLLWRIQKAPIQQVGISEASRGPSWNSYTKGLCKKMELHTHISVFFLQIWKCFTKLLYTQGFMKPLGAPWGFCRCPRWRVLHQAPVEALGTSWGL